MILFFYNLVLKNNNHKIQLEFDRSSTIKPYDQDGIDNYWKFSLFVDDIQKIYTELLKLNHPVGAPFQFGNIGYLSHTTDTEHHQIEFIQKTFKQNEILNTDEQIALGLLTIRTKDPVKIIKFYEDILDLKLFVRMYVNRGDGFTLYFLGNKNLQAPNTDIDVIENREWMYQQSHLFIEIQYWNSEHDNNFLLNSTLENGLQIINFSGDLNILRRRLIESGVVFQERSNKIIFQTIDNHTIKVKTAHNNV
ncbi:hypothetical protein ACFSTE_03085 [Aquimarina hainanensis]|uniref:VOC domain-containing protein n=1 Tax=Aquimarina hainanensis TaxID=1578017 RepID=A0ABW5N3Z6_9FLAO